MPRVVFSHEEFLTMHGQGPIVKLDPRTFALPDGASYQVAGNRDGAIDRYLYFNPPTGIHDLLQARRRYQQILANMAATAFNNLKGALLGRGVFQWNQAITDLFGPPPPGGEMGALLALKEAADKHRALLADLDAKIFMLPEQQEKRAREIEARRYQEQVREEQRRRRDEIEAVCLESVFLPIQDSPATTPGD